jgi:hypothetical protein
MTSSTFTNIEWIIANHGSITIGDVGARVGCVAAAADTHMCYAMLAQRCVFRLMPGHSSGASRTGIPVHAGPPFRGMPGRGCEAG